MNITMTKNNQSGDTIINIVLPHSYLAHDCEAYGPPELCNLITTEQGLGIIEDAVLMAMHLKRRE